MNDDLLKFLLIGGPATLVLVMGLLARLGIWRSIYVFEGNPVATPQALVFVLIPGGIMLLSLFFILILPVAPETRGDLILYIFGPLLIAIYILAVWQPWWLKPKWLRWLEAEHGHIIHILRDEARQAGWKWEREVRTQEQLEAWVAEVRRRRNL